MLDPIDRGGLIQVLLSHSDRSVNRDRAGSTSSASSSPTANSSMVVTWSRMAWRTAAVDALPTRSHTTFGGELPEVAVLRHDDVVELRGVLPYLAVSRGDQSQLRDVLTPREDVTQLPDQVPRKILVEQQLRCL